jgi:hypothetical protein
VYGALSCAAVELTQVGPLELRGWQSPSPHTASCARRARRRSAGCHRPSSAADRTGFSRTRSRACCAPACVALHDLRRRGRRKEPARARVRRGRRGRDRPYRPLPAVRRGRHVLAARGDGEGVLRDHGRRPARQGAGEAQGVLRGRGGRRPARPRRRRARGRRRRAQPAGDRMGRPRVGGAARAGAAARARVRGRPLGRGAAARVVRASRGQRPRAPLLLVCVAPQAPLDVHPSWGGGRVRAISIELEPLGPEESARLVGLSAPTSRNRSTRRPCSRRRRATRSSWRRRSGCSPNGREPDVERIPTRCSS